MHYHPRIIQETFEKYLKIFSIVGLLGPRQSGKSTFLKNVLTEYQYVTFDDHRMVTLFYDDPEKFIRIYSDKIIFDEVQKVPEIFDMLKLHVDNDRQRKGKFVISSSSQFSFHKNITETLAGRIGLLTLLPYQFNELPAEFHSMSIYKGSYPELLNNRYNYTTDWYSAYMDTYINRDVRQLANIGDINDYQRLMQLLAANTSQQLNMSRFANDLGVDVKTIKRWISILEASFIIFLLPPFYENYGKRIIKSSKLYFYDMGLVSYLTGIDTQAQYENGPLAGALFENYIVSEILKKELHVKSHANLYFIRTASGEEVDLIIDRKSYKHFIEIKKSETFRPNMLKIMEKFIKNDNDRGTLLYNGNTLPMVEPFSVLNYQDFLK